MPTFAGGDIQSTHAALIAWNGRSARLRFTAFRSASICRAGKSAWRSKRLTVKKASASRHMVTAVTGIGEPCQLPIHSAEPPSALRPTRAVLLPSPRRANPLARIGRYFRYARHGCTGAPSRPAAGPEEGGGKNVGRPQHHPKTDVVVPVVGVIPVAVGAPGVVAIVVPRAATHDLPRPPDRVATQRGDDNPKKAFFRGGGSLPRTP